MEWKRFELGPDPAAYFNLTAFRETVAPMVLVSADSWPCPYSPASKEAAGRLTWSW